MIIGMDFGTTNSGMAHFDGQDLRLIPLDPAGRNPHIIPTALYITGDRMVYPGAAATQTYYEQNLNRPVRMEMVRVGEIELTFAELPTFIRDVYIEKDIYSPGRLFRSFKMGLSSQKYLGTVVGNEYFFLEDIIAVYLYITRKRAAAHLQTDLDSIVLGRPVRFSDNENLNALAQERLLLSAFRAGYKNVYLQAEPIAAAYHYEMTLDHEQNILIFDFGGGTLDISILRVGNPKTRQVLATGGIPIAGDIFDRKVVRNKMPEHFGEGSHYYDADRKLSVPSSFYDAFEDWQELLTLNLPRHLETLKRIAHTSTRPQQLNALLSLVTGNYAMKLFDEAEASKRRLSQDYHTKLHIESDDFNIQELLTRNEFERIIRPETRAIAARLDDILAMAGLKPDEIDAVIRTGGSSQIPVFINMLAERFGREKIQHIDEFSSVTSGLGVIGHRIEQGDIDLKRYTEADITGGDYLNSTEHGGIPVLDIEMMKTLLRVAETRNDASTGTRQVLFLRDDEKLHVSAHDVDSLSDDKTPGELSEATAPAALMPEDDRALLITTDYRFMLRDSGQLADLYSTGMQLETLENFRSDAFSTEVINSIAPWSDLENSTATLLISTLGYGRLFLGERFIRDLSAPSPYQLKAKLRGKPAFILNVTKAKEFILLSHAGRAVRIPIDALSSREQRLIQVPLKTGNIVSAIALHQPQELILTTASGYARRLHSADIPQTTEISTSGEKLIARTKPVALTIYQPDSPLMAITTQRIVKINPADIPPITTDTDSTRLLKLKKGETLLNLIAL